MTTKKEKKKNSIIKKVLLFGGIGFLLLIIAMILTPIFFKDKLKDMALAEANTMLKSDVAVGDFDLTIISTFPKMKLVFNDVSITGRDEFDGIKLVDIKTLETKLDFWSVINMDDINIRSIKLVDPNVHVKILENGVANYDIVKSSEELAEEQVDTTASFNLDLNRFEIINGNIYYEDLDTLSPMMAGIQKLNTVGNGVLTGEKIKFVTENTIEELAFQMDNDLDVSGKDFKLNGTVDLTGNLSDFDLDATLGEFLMKMSGQNADIQNLVLKGTAKMSDKDMVVQTKTNADEISYQYSGVPYLSKVKTDLDLDLIMDFLDDGYKFTLKDNNVKLNALNFSLDGFYEYLSSHSNMDLKLNAGNTKFKDLLSLVPAFYHTGYESMLADGNMKLDGFVKGRLDDKNYPGWNFNFDVNNASIKYPDMPENIQNVNIKANTKFPGGSNLDAITVDVDDLKATFADNTIDGNFYLKYPMSDPLLKSKLNLDVDLATIDKVYPLEEKYSGKLTSDIELEGRLSAIENERYQEFNASGNLRLQEFNYVTEDLPDPLDIKDMWFEFSPEKLRVSQMDAKMGKSDFKVDGELRNYMNYMFKENEELKGNLNVHTNYLDVDKFMGTSSSETTEASELTESSEPILVPKNIDFVMNTSADEVIYDGMSITNLKGKVSLKDQVAHLNNLSMNALGGSVTLNGKYNTQDPKAPEMDFGWGLKDLRIKTLVEKFVTIEKLAPIGKYIDGNVSSNFTMNTLLKPDFEPIFNTLNGTGSLFSSSLDILGFEPLKELADKLQITRLKDQTIKNLNASFTFEEGKVMVKPFNIKLGNINTLVEGTTSFEQDIDYKLEMKIPKSDIPKDVLALAEKGIEQIKKIPGFKMNIKDLPNEIPVTAFLTNTIKQPVVKTNLKEKLMELGGNIKDDIQDLIEDKIEEVKDSIQNVIDDKVEDLKEEVEKQKQKILSEAQSQADRIIAEAKKLADKTRDEANKNAQKIIDQAGDNFLKKKAAEVAANKVKDEGEKAAKKIENEAQTRADGIMKRAREQADRIK